MVVLRGLIEDQMKLLLVFIYIANGRLGMGILSRGMGTTSLLQATRDASGQSGRPLIG